MKQDTGKVFDELAASYARYRPHWPAETIDAVAGVSRGHRLALEVGCGSGQATALLAPHFDCVIATDPAPAAIERAPTIDNVQWAVGRCDATPAGEGSVDLIVAAQAAHWFDMEPFAEECRRIGRPEARVALLGYDLLSMDDGPIDEMVQAFYRKVRIDWDERRRHVDARYADILFPFADLDPPEILPITDRWSVEGMLGYLRTWSGVRNATKRTGKDPVVDIEGELRRLWGDETRGVSFPVFLRLGAVH